MNRTYPTDTTRTLSESLPVANQLIVDSVNNDFPYYTSADANDSVVRTFNIIDGVINSRPVGPTVRGRTREAKFRTDPVRELPNDDSDCEGDEIASTRCEAEYKTHVVTDEVVEQIYPADTDRTVFGLCDIIVREGNDTASEYGIGANVTICSPSQSVCIDGATSQQTPAPENIEVSSTDTGVKTTSDPQSDSTVSVIEGTIAPKGTTGTSPVVNESSTVSVNP